MLSLLAIRRAWALRWWIQARGLRPMNWNACSTGFIAGWVRRVRAVAWGARVAPGLQGGMRAPLMWVTGGEEGGWLCGGGGLRPAGEWGARARALGAAGPSFN